MKYCSIIALAALAGVAAAQTYNVQLCVKSDTGNEPVDGMFLQAVKEDESTYYFFLGNQTDAVTVTFDSSASRVSINVDSVTFFLATSKDNFLVATSDDTESRYATIGVSDSDSRLYVDGFAFYARKDVSDPIGYSNNTYAILSSTYVADAETFGFGIVSSKTGGGSPSNAGIFNPKNISGIPFVSSTTSTANTITTARSSTSGRTASYTDDFTETNAEWASRESEIDRKLFGGAGRNSMAGGVGFVALLAAFI